MPELKGIQPITWFFFEVSFTTIFSCEYVFRCLTATVFGSQTQMEFFLGFMNMCDFLAIMPFFIELIGRSSQGHVLRILRSVRMFRLFRVLKLGRYSTGMRIMGETIRRSAAALWVLAFFVGIAVVLFSSVVWYMEKFACPNSKWREDWSPDELVEYTQLCEYSSDGWASEKYGLCCSEMSAPDGLPTIIHSFWWAIVPSSKTIINSMGSYTFESLV